MWEDICGTRAWVSIRVLGYMYVYIREYIYYLVSLVFSSLFREDVHVGRMVEGVGSREARACDLTWSVWGWSLTGLQADHNRTLVVMTSIQCPPNFEPCFCSAAWFLLSTNVLMGSIRFRGVCDSDEYYALGWTKKKNIRIRNVASQSQIWCLGAAETRFQRKSTWKSCEVSKTLELRGIVWVDSRSLRSSPELLRPLVQTWY